MVPKKPLTRPNKFLCGGVESSVGGSTTVVGRGVVCRDELGKAVSSGKGAATTLGRSLARSRPRKTSGASAATVGSDLPSASARGTPEPIVPEFSDEEEFAEFCNWNFPSRASATFREEMEACSAGCWVRGHPQEATGNSV